MRGRLPEILSIAGFDPSGGAGVLADIKVFEQHGLLGCGIATSITFQNDLEFEGLDWIAFEKIEKQFNILAKQFHFTHVKIGLVENLEVLLAITEMLKMHNEDVQIIWDPIIKASAGFVFHHDIHKEQLSKVLANVLAITANIDETIALSGTDKAEDGAYKLSKEVNVILKGGHADDEAADSLYYNGDIYIYPIARLPETFAKHGSGCVFSSAFTARLALGDDMGNACRAAKEYTYQYLQSNEALLGLHHYVQVEEVDNVPL